jgi:nucleoside-diphosphate-sugar epimerase
MPTYVVTGSAGFIGSHLVDALLRRGDSVIGIDCFTDFYARQEKEANIASFRDHTRFRRATADLAAEDIDDLFRGAEGIFHLAAQPGVRGSWGSTFDVYARDNIVATQKIFEAAARASVKVVFASSSSVYGDAASYPTAEEVPPAPISPYGVTKLCCEHLAHAYATTVGLHVVALRYFTVYGPRQRPDMAIRRLLDALLAGKEFTILGDGRQSRDFTYVDDAVSATLLAMDKRTAGTIFNVGGGSEVSLLDVVDTAEKIAGQRLHRRTETQAVGDVRRTSADTRLVKRELGWSPRVSLAEGLRRQLLWAASNDEEERQGSA